MRSDELVIQLHAAGGREQNEIPPENIFRATAFDGGKKRLGWSRSLDTETVKNVLTGISDIIYPFETFVFVCMGGSVNGIKPLLSLLPGSKVHTLDSLDPAALAQLKAAIPDLKKTMAIPVSKSGTTKETQLIASSLRELFGVDWQKHFLFLADKGSFAKIDALGWQGVKKISIQFDTEEDIGGRFSCPQTLIFFLPLFILFDRDIHRIETLLAEYSGFKKDISKQAAELAVKHQGQDPAYFCPIVKEPMQPVLASWLYQLFQESIGSKKDGLAVKTVVMREKGHEAFVGLPLVMNFNDPVLYLMAHMYFFQCFVAFYSAVNGINFVSQDFVEKYKDQMRRLEGQKMQSVKAYNLRELIDVVGPPAGKYKFIDVVLYFHPGAGLIAKVKEEFVRAFPGKNTIVAVGSDWNHHSYQATFGDKETFFVLLLAGFYDTDLGFIGKDILEKNVEALRVIARATHLTIENKSILLALEN